MNTSFKHTERRDFVDFLLLLYRHSRIFYMTFVSLLFLAILIHFFQSPIYKFNLDIKVSESNSIFMPIIMYRNNLKQASNNPVSNKEEKEFSSLGVDRLVSDLLIGGKIYNILDPKFYEGYYYSAQIYQFLKKFEQAELYYNMIPSTHNLHIESKKNIALNKSKLNKFAEGEIYLLELISLHPNEDSLLITLADLYRFKKKI